MTWGVNFGDTPLGKTRLDQLVSASRSALHESKEYTGAFQGHCQGHWGCRGVVHKRLFLLLGSLGALAPLSVLALAACGSPRASAPDPQPPQTPGSASLDQETTAAPTPSAGFLAPFVTPSYSDLALWDSLVTYFQGFGVGTGYTWRTDISRALISPQEVQFLYAPRVQPLSLDASQVEPVAQANEWLYDYEPVVAVEVNGEARAYPLQIQIFVVQEVVNDHLGGVPIAITY